MTDYFKDNPQLVCKCGRKFRKFGIDKKGNNREYTQCMQCTIDDWNKKNFKK